ncbi:unnamed protein product [Polarella glacialis]|uniref:Uncharacterized protein n=1 Tax=Polarella glacialis TaxID=89957 RepID=A0A813JZE6_POLGL|nr:unnamed protein product [Polarella glacialis]
MSKVTVGLGDVVAQFLPNTVRYQEALTSQVIVAGPRIAHPLPAASFEPSFRPSRGCTDVVPGSAHHGSFRELAKMTGSPVVSYLGGKPQGQLEREEQGGRKALPIAQPSSAQEAWADKFDAPSRQELLRGSVQPRQQQNLIDKVSGFRSYESRRRQVWADAAELDAAGGLGGPLPLVAVAGGDWRQLRSGRRQEVTVKLEPRYAELLRRSREPGGSCRFAFLLEKTEEGGFEVGAKGRVCKMLESEVEPSSSGECEGLLGAGRSNRFLQRIGFFHFAVCGELLCAAAHAFAVSLPAGLARIAGLYSEAMLQSGIDATSWGILEGYLKSVFREEGGGHVTQRVSTSGFRGGNPVTIEGEAPCRVTELVSEEARLVHVLVLHLIFACEGGFLSSRKERELQSVSYLSSVTGVLSDSKAAPLFRGTLEELDEDDLGLVLMFVLKSPDSGRAADGSVVTWGDADRGSNSSAVAPLLTEGVVQVCGNIGAFAAIKADGSVVTWGATDCGSDSSAVAQFLTEGVVQVCGIIGAFAAIKVNGSVVTWGSAANGGNSSAVAQLLTEGVIQVCGNGSAFAAIKVNGSVVTWGSAAYGGNSSAVAPLLTEGVVQVCGNGCAFAAIKVNGSVVTWGATYCGGDSSAVAPLLTEGVVQVCGNGCAFAAIKANGSVVTWGVARSGGDSSAFAPLLTEGVVQVCETRLAFAAIKVNGSVVTWGDAAYGGNSSAVAPLLTERIVQVCGNGSAFAAIKVNGSVVTWGATDCGGDSSAVAPLLTEGVVQVCGNGCAFAAIKANGSVVTWGVARSGGDSSAFAPLLTEGVVQVCETRLAFAAIKVNGSVVTWGVAACGGNSSAVAPLLTEGHPYESQASSHETESTVTAALHFFPPFAVRLSTSSVQLGQEMGGIYRLPVFIAWGARVDNLDAVLNAASSSSVLLLMAVLSRFGFTYRACECQLESASSLLWCATDRQLAIRQRWMLTVLMGMTDPGQEGSAGSPWQGLLDSDRQGLESMLGMMSSYRQIIGQMDRLLSDASQSAEEVIDAVEDEDEEEGRLLRDLHRRGRPHGDSGTESAYTSSRRLPASIRDVEHLSESREMTMSDFTAGRPLRSRPSPISDSSSGQTSSVQAESRLSRLPPQPEVTERRAGTPVSPETDRPRPRPRPVLGGRLSRLQATGGLGLGRRWL